MIDSYLLQLLNSLRNVKITMINIKSCKNGMNAAAIERERSGSDVLQMPNDHRTF